MSDVARAAGVSISTVSHVLNNTRYVEPSTEERVRAVIAQLGYRHNHLARAVARGGRSQSIGVAVSAWTNPYFGAVVSAVDDAVAAMGSTLLLGETGEDSDREYRLINSLLERRADGIVIAPSPRAGERTLPLLERSGVPTVLLDRLAPGSDLDQVGTENLEATGQLVDHLGGLHGHLRIGLIAGLAGLSTTEERVAGYLAGVQRNNGDDDPALVCTGGSSTDQGFRAAAQLLDLKRPPTALIAGNNEMAVGALRLLKARAVSVPNAMAVCSFDDFEWAELMTSPITSIAQDWSQIGHRAVALLRARIEDPDRPATVERVPAALTVRNSCGCRDAD